MYYLFGEKKIFAVEIEIVRFEPQLTGKALLWINTFRIGIFEDINLLAPFLNSLKRIAYDNGDLWDSHLEGLNCEEIFKKIIPGYDNLSFFSNMSDLELSAVESFDKFLFNWGENFDQWTIRVVIENKVCKFLWEHNFNKTEKISCFDISQTEVKNIYQKIVEAIPEKYLPLLIKKNS